MLALRAQISPHFIYNALNTIASFVRTDPDRARELILEFADFTRYSFRAAGQYTTLADELRNIDRYLTLERARFGANLQGAAAGGPGGAQRRGAVSRAATVGGERGAARAGRQRRRIGGDRRARRGRRMRHHRRGRRRGHGSREAACRAGRRTGRPHRRIRRTSG